MKVLLINGSAIKKGNTFVALTEIAKTLQTEGIDSEIIKSVGRVSFLEEKIKSKERVNLNSVNRRKFYLWRFSFSPLR